MTAIASALQLLWPQDSRCDERAVSRKGQPCMPCAGVQGCRQLLIISPTQKQAKCLRMLVTGKPSQLSAQLV